MRGVEDSVFIQYFEMVLLSDSSLFNEVVEFFNFAFISLIDYENSL
jgi:hypothetical protein